MKKPSLQTALLLIVVVQLTFLCYRELEHKRLTFPEYIAKAFREAFSDDSGFSLADEGVEEDMVDAFEIFTAEGKELLEERKRQVAKLGEPGESEAEVRAYIEALVKIASSQKMSGGDSPEPAALRKLRPEDLPILFEYLHTPLGDHTEEVIAELARADQKDLLLAAFVASPQIRGAIVKYGWARECPQALVRHIRAAEDMHKTYWTEIGMQSEDQDVYLALMDAHFEAELFDKENEIPEAAKNAPGFPLAEFYERIWLDSATNFFRPRTETLLMECVQYGSVSALIEAARRLTARDPGKLDLRTAERNWEALEALISRLLPPGTDVAWVLEQGNKIQFDEDVGRYELNGSEY